MADTFKRTDRINKQLARLLAETLLHVEDKRLRQVNITRVQATGDLRSAKVFYTVMVPTPRIEKVLSSAAGFLRAELARRAKLRVTPELLFYYDDTSDQIRLIESLMRPKPETDSDDLS